MRYYFRMTTVLLCLLVSVFWLFSCEKKKEGKVVVTEKEFVIRPDSDHSYAIDATGKVKNVGEVDVKRVVLTGYCRSCGEAPIHNSWFVSRGIEKAEVQKDTINYLAVGDEEEFSFKEITFCWGPIGFKAPEKPDQLEVEIISFETVDD
jgi:hypothetical protein